METDGSSSDGGDEVAGRVESFTVRLVHNVDMYGLRTGYTPTLLVHTAVLPCRYLTTWAVVERERES
jgi:hypothetical protein